MDHARCHIAGGPNPLASALTSLLAEAAPACPTLVNADAVPDVETVTKRCRAFAGGGTAEDSLIVVMLLAAPPGLAQMAVHQAAASLWAFTREAALEWAPLRIRVNAIGLGRSPAGPFEPQEQAGRAAFPAPAAPASLDDIARTIRAMAAWRSMTGQIIRLGV